MRTETCDKCGHLGDYPDDESEIEASTLTADGSVFVHDTCLGEDVGPMNTNTVETLIVSRFAVRYDDTGMVIGDGATKQEAWEDARQEAGRGAGSINAFETGDLSDCSAIEYDPCTHEIRMQDGIVQLLPRR